MKRTYVFAFWAVVSTIAVLAVIGNRTALPPNGVPSFDPSDPHAIDPSAQPAEWSKVIQAAVPQDVEVKDIKIGSNDISASLEYASIPFMAVPRSDTKAAAQAVLDKLIAKGRSPMAEHIVVFVFAQARVRGATGATMYRMLGHSQYDPNTDQIEFFLPD